MEIKSIENKLFIKVVEDKYFSKLKDKDYEEQLKILREWDKSDHISYREFMYLIKRIHEKS